MPYYYVLVDVSKIERQILKWRSQNFDFQVQKIRLQVNF